MACHSSPTSEMLLLRLTLCIGLREQWEAGRRCAGGREEGG